MKEETQVVYISEDGNFRSTRKVDVENYENAVNNYVKEEWYPAGTLRFTIYFKRKCHSEPLDSYLEIEESDSGRYRLYSVDGYGDPGNHFWDKKSFDDLETLAETFKQYMYSTEPNVGRIKFEDIVYDEDNYDENDLY